MSMLELVVKHVAAETPHIQRIDLVAANVQPLPPFAAGAHITVAVPGIGPRKYSLVRTVAAAQEPAPKSYTLGVRRDPQGGGGSIFIHALKVGDRISAEPPKNDFPLRAGTGAVALIGGGIGITPLIGMAAELKAADRLFTLVYAARARQELAFLASLQSMLGPQLTIHVDDEAGHVFDVKKHFATVGPVDRVYMCGPKPMLKAGIDACRTQGWPRDRLSFELFYSAAPPVAPQPKLEITTFEVVIKSTGQSFRVPPGKSILDVLIDAGIDPLFDCKKGECGVCGVGVLEGIPDHRDSILSDSDRAANTTMQICISRAKSPRLVLDL
jgi:ferredoxin-NADP reductase